MRTQDKDEVLHILLSHLTVEKVPLRSAVGMPKTFVLKYLNELEDRKDFNRLLELLKDEDMMKHSDVDDYFLYSLKK